MFQEEMEECSHNISPLRAITCSGPFKCRCPDCGAVLVRRHTRTSAFLEFLFSVMGLPIIVLFFLAIIWLPWVVFGTAALFVGFYAWDTSANPLHVETSAEAAADRKSNLQALVVFGIILLSVAVYLVI